MILIAGHDVAVAQWVASKTGREIAPPYTALGWIGRDDHLAIGMVFYGYAPRGNLDMAVAASGLLTRGVIRAAAHYAFVQVGARRVTARPPALHERAIAILRRVGFVREAVLKDFYEDDDAVQLRLRRRDAERWL